MKFMGMWWVLVDDEIDVHMMGIGEIYEYGMVLVIHGI